MSLPPQRPLLYLISNRRAFPRNSDQIEAIRRAARAGCQLIQIREKDLSACALGEFVREAIGAARPHGAKVLVNDRLDVAMAAGADGVHLRVSSLPAVEVRRVVREKGLRNFLIGVSTHSIREAQAAEQGEADFVVFGPVHDTPSKREYGMPVGIEALAATCQAVRIPVLALGGINLANFHESLQAGASGIAAIGLFAALDRIEPAIKTLLGASGRLT